MAIAFPSHTATDDLIAAVADALPTWPSYHTFDGEPHAHLLRAGTVRVDPDHGPAVLANLRALPDSIADAAYPTAGWRDGDLTDTVRAWGWAATAITSHTHISGLWGDAVFPANFAALHALLPHATDDGTPWVFGAVVDTEPVFALTLTPSGLTLHTAVEVDYLLD